MDWESMCRYLESENLRLQVRMADLQKIADDRMTGVVKHAKARRAQRDRFAKLVSDSVRPLGSGFSCCSRSAWSSVAESVQHLPDCLVLKIKNAIPKPEPDEIPQLDITTKNPANPKTGNQHDAVESSNPVSQNSEKV